MHLTICSPGDNELRQSEPVVSLRQRFNTEIASQTGLNLLCLVRAKSPPACQSLDRCVLSSLYVVKATERPERSVTNYKRIDHPNWCLRQFMGIAETTNEKMRISCDEDRQTFSAIRK
jgi:hypothetical protein